MRIIFDHAVRGGSGHFVSLSVRRRSEVLRVAIGTNYASE